MLACEPWAVLANQQWESTLQSRGDKEQFSNCLIYKMCCFCAFCQSLGVTETISDHVPTSPLCPPHRHSSHICCFRHRYPSSKAGEKVKG
ncbi:hypothetical protein SCA6_019031 [Theobroma cacao]